jgi:hypothetical protein
MFRGSQMIEERANFRRPQFAGMLPASRPLPVEFQELPRPHHVGFLGAQRVMFDPQNLAQLVEQLGFGVGNDERSLCRTGFGRHDLPKCNRGRGIRKKNLPVAGQEYTAFPLPTSC